MDKSPVNVYEKLAAAEEQVKAGKTKDAAEGLQASREKLRLATERLASEIDKGEEIQLREYLPSDCEQLAELFYQTVHSVNAKDYTEEQLDAWATGTVDLCEWNSSFLKHKTIVAVENGEIVGFGDMDSTGYLDRLYVHKCYQRKGVASAICDALESSSKGKKFTTHASITAKPFFQHRGYRAVKEQEVLRQGIALANYVMEK